MIPLQCEELECVFGGVRALDGASVSVGADDFVGLMGSNAAGKTTLLNAICALVPLKSGKISLYGKDITQVSARQRALAGIVRSFEDGSICDRLSAVDNVAMGLRRGWLRQRRVRALCWLDKVQLEEYRDAEGGALSVGQRRRLELARILARAEEFDGRCIVLLDEPFRGLDDPGRQALLSLLREFFVGKLPVVMVEHNREMIKQLNAQPLWMERGRVTAGPGFQEARPNSRVEAYAPPTGAKLLVLNDIRAGYGSVEVLHGISLVVREGEDVRLAGGNGAGKSSLMRVIMGTLRISRGSMEVMGTRLDDAHSRPFHGVAYAPQGGRLVRQLTIRDHLEMGRDIANRRGIRPNLGPAFLDAFPELRQVIGRRAGDVSSGQRSLAAMATALSSEPRLLLADEPAGGLSFELAERLYLFLRERWHAPDRATIIVEHDAFDYPARSVHLVRGEIV